jgi:solute carrier family 35 protein E1
MANRKLQKTVKVAGILLAWWIFSVTAGIYNKAYLDIYSMPIFLTFAQSLCGAVSGFIALNILKQWQTISNIKEFKFLAVLTSAHEIGTLLTNMSTSAASASFMHTVKAAEPLTSAILAVIILKERLKTITIVSLLIIVFGIGLSCSTEFNFSLYAFVTAMASNLVFSSRTIFSKKLLLESKLDNQNVFLYISFFSTVATLPLLSIELYKYGYEPFVTSFAPTSSAASLLFKASISHYLYNVFSFLALNEMAPISHGVSNSFKRLFIIYSSILYFQNPVTSGNLVSSAIAVSGVVLYSWSLQSKTATEVK